MVDGEDAQALRDDVIARGRENAVGAFREAGWNKTLRFYRPSGLNLQYCIDDLVIVLTQAAKGVAPEDFPVDGIIWPKAEHPEELKMISDLLGELEEKLGLEKNRIKMQFLVESGWGAAQLFELVKPVMPRLAGIIFGIADYSADVDLPVIENNHPVCDWARATIINVAGALGVPAIDNMTVNYPVADKTLSLEGNKAMILDRLKEAFDDAAHGQALGMDGKWVGHPAQLFVVRLAYSQAFPEAEVIKEVEKIEAYTVAVEAELGATIIEGVMSDRATDRHARRKLRKAVALGYLDPERALRVGIITADEAAEATK
jgi:citrate lyase beta subunit